jgi:hypothetical protein
MYWKAFWKPLYIIWANKYIYQPSFSLTSLKVFVCDAMASSSSFLFSLIVWFILSVSFLKMSSVRKESMKLLASWMFKKKKIIYGSDCFSYLVLTFDLASQEQLKDFKFFLIFNYVRNKYISRRFIILYTL